MKDKLHDAFDTIQASDRLKRNTRAHIRRKTFDYGRNLLRLKAHKRRLVTVALSLMLICSGAGIWFVPSASIAVDINPSVELKVNALDRVISLQGKNADGIRVVQGLDVTGMTYDDAMQRILLSNGLKPYLDKGSTITITVTGGGTDAHAEKMLSKVLCRAYNIAEKDHILYCQVDWETLRAAEKAGLSVPRYLAWQQLLLVDPYVTQEDIWPLSVEQIRALAQTKLLENPCGE